MIVANNLISIESAMHAIRQIDKAIRTHDEELAKEQFKIPWQSKMIRVINVLICLSFLIGLGIIVVNAAKL